MILCFDDMFFCHHSYSCISWLLLFLLLQNKIVFVETALLAGLQSKSIQCAKFTSSSYVLSLTKTWQCILLLMPKRDLMLQNNKKEFMIWIKTFYNLNRRWKRVRKITLIWIQCTSRIWASLSWMLDFWIEPIILLHLASKVVKTEPKILLFYSGHKLSKLFEKDVT